MHPLATDSLFRMPAAQPGYYQPPNAYHSGPPGPGPAPYPYHPAPPAQYPPRPGMPLPFGGTPPRYQTAPGKLLFPLVNQFYSILFPFSQPHSRLLTRPPPSSDLLPTRRGPVRRVRLLGTPRGPPQASPLPTLPTEATETRNASGGTPW